MQVGCYMSIERDVQQEERGTGTFVVEFAYPVAAVAVVVVHGLGSSAVVLSAVEPTAVVAELSAAAALQFVFAAERVAAAAPLVVFAFSAVQLQQKQQ